MYKCKEEICHEQKVYKKVRKIKGIPKILFQGEESMLFSVHELLGVNLKKVFNFLDIGPHN